MAKNVSWAIGAGFILAAAACSNDGDSGGSGGASGMAGSGTAAAGGASAGTSGSAGSATGGMSGGAAAPAITEAPPAWARPADCGGIGDLCPEGIFGCGERSSCQLEGYVCIPALEPGATSLPGRTAETPYCAAYTCMTFEEASCFCTGEAGAVTPSCSSPAALAGLCSGEDASCATKDCCDGLTCLDLGTSERCEKSCTSNADCSTGCCTDLYDTGVSVCAELDACENPCKKTGEACSPGSATTPSDCCRGSCVESENLDYAGCRPSCATNDDCPDTGCCVPFSNSTSGFCADALYCTCNETGGACGPGNPECCEGFACATYDDGASFSCLAACDDPSDCPSGNCELFTDSTTGVCGDACKSLGDACGNGVGSCCDGTACAGFVEGAYTCHLACDDDQDCPGGYCSLFEDGSGGVCPDEMGGECVPEGGSCGPGFNECCDGLCQTPDLTIPATCASFCTLPSDCASNCCLDSGSPEGSTCRPASSCE